jgi:ATP-binding cassette subfamily C (CFTR/MRP) protein 4
VFLFVSLQMGLSLLGAVIVVALVNIWMLIPTVFMFSLFYLLRVYFVATSRSIKRLEGISKLTYQMDI